jgi:hypothetical protein
MRQRIKFESPRCECGHTCRFYVRAQIWRCTSCGKEFTIEEIGACANDVHSIMDKTGIHSIQGMLAVSVIEPSNFPDISDIKNFKKEDSSGTLAPALKPVPVASMATPVPKPTESPQPVQKPAEINPRLLAMLGQHDHRNDRQPALTPAGTPRGEY